MKNIIVLLCLIVSLVGCSIGNLDVPTEPATLEGKMVLRSATIDKKPRLGYDVLGLAMYCDRFLKAPKLPALSTLLNTFGDPMPCVEKRIGQGGLELVQVDLIDATCWRNNKCPPGVPRPDDLNAIKKRAQSVYAYAVRYPQIEWWVSAGLEHDVKDANKVQAMMNAAKAGCPSCNVINSPFSGAKLNPLELHGTKVRAFSVSGDGASLFDGDNLKDDGNNFQHRISGSDQCYAWWNELNLRCTGEKDFTTPLKRTAKPTADQFMQAYLTMISPEPAKPGAPKQCKGVRDIQQGKEITKPNAEAYCNGQPNASDSRGNKPLLIIKVSGKRGDRMDVLRPDGRKVGSFCYYGTFPDLAGTHRWYMGNCSGQTPAQLYNDLGGEWGFVKLRNGSCLRFNAIRRQGTYR